MFQTRGNYREVSAVSNAFAVEVFDDNDGQAESSATKPGAHCSAMTIVTILCLSFCVVLAVVFRQEWLARHNVAGVTSIHTFIATAQKQNRFAATGASSTTDAADFCVGVQDEVEYHTSKPLYSMGGIPTPEMCCAKCDGEPLCGAWTWAREAGWNGRIPTCFLKQVLNGEELQKVHRPGVISGLPNLQKHGVVAEILGNYTSSLVNLSNVTEVPELDANETCRGQIDVKGYGPQMVTNAQWLLPETQAAAVYVLEPWAVEPHIGSRAYFADVCTTAVYNQSAYASMKLLGGTFRYTTDLSGAGCGCNAKLHLVPMAQHTVGSGFGDYYCSASSSSETSCADFGLQDANQYAWASTLHVRDDTSGLGVGYGGSGFTARREWNELEYGPGGTCIDTTWPFEVAVSFPVDERGMLKAMEVVLSQVGRDCSLFASIDNYRFEGRNGLQELTKVLEDGVTPVISYTRSSDMSILDGVGSDGKGPCVKDAPDECPATVRFYHFLINATDAGVSRNDRVAYGQLDIALGMLHDHTMKLAVKKRAAVVERFVHSQEVTDGSVHEHSETNDRAQDVALQEQASRESDWEVLQEALPVRHSNGSASKSIDVKVQGQIFQGKRQGDWIKLGDEPGFVAFSSGAVRERSVTYEKIASGTCADVALFPITDAITCQNAGFALGYIDHRVSIYFGNQMRPEGCYVFNGQLWLSGNPANTGNGADKHRSPICGDFPYRTTTTISSTVTSSTTSTITSSTSTTTWLHPSIFCFAVMRRHGCGPQDCSEYGLIKAQIKAQVGMFLCDEFAVLSQEKEMSLGKVRGKGSDVKTLWFKHAPVGRSADGFAANTELFINVWDVIGKDGRWKRLDWTIKADPDAVILPWRIRTHLGPVTGQNNYVPNCNWFANDPFYPMVYGSFEVFSKMAMQRYFSDTGGAKCKSTLQWRPWGEDKYIGECMKFMGVAQATDIGILSDRRCGGSGSCSDGNAAAYHFFKEIHEWFACWNQATAPPR